MLLGRLFKNSNLVYCERHFGIIFIVAVIAEIYGTFCWGIHYVGVDAFVILFFVYYLICPDLSRRLNVYRETYILCEQILFFVIIAIYASINNGTGYENSFRLYLECIFAREGLNLLLLLIFINYAINLSINSKLLGGQTSIILSNNVVFTVRLLLVVVFFTNIIKINNYMVDYNYMRFEIIEMHGGIRF